MSEDTYDDGWRYFIDIFHKEDHRPMNKRPFLIDCDTGTDDAIAIMAALGSPQVEVRAVTSVNGNVSENYTSQNNLDLLEYLGRTDIPVAHGAVRPLLSGIVNDEGGTGTHGKTGLGTITLPHAQCSSFDCRIASELVYDLAVECAGDLELLVIGPMTNIAIALCNHRDLAGLIKHIWFMGGAAHGGNVSPTAEFNIWVDPEAAHIVFQSGIPMTMVGLDVTLKAVMTEEDVAQLRCKGSKAGTLAADLLDFMLQRRARAARIWSCTTPWPLRPPSARNALPAKTFSRMWSIPEVIPRATPLWICAASLAGLPTCPLPWRSTLPCSVNGW